MGYKAGVTRMKELGADIYSRLPPNHQKGVCPDPISYDTSVKPFVRVMRMTANGKTVNGVWVSAGFIDLANKLGHAKAIDKWVKRGYYKAYIEQLASETGDSELKSLPNIENPKFWSEKVRNEQESNFNSIVAIILGVNLAHHYLGHFETAQGSLSLSDNRSITSLLSSAEWEEAFAAGVMSSLQAGCSVEGIVPFFEAFGRMKERPQWADFFLPPHASVVALVKHTKAIQREFFDE